MNPLADAPRSVSQPLLSQVPSWSKNSSPIPPTFSKDQKEPRGRLVHQATPFSFGTPGHMLMQPVCIVSQRSSTHESSDQPSQCHPTSLHSIQKNRTAQCQPHHQPSQPEPIDTLGPSRRVEVTRLIQPVSGQKKGGHRSALQKEAMTSSNQNGNFTPRRTIVWSSSLSPRTYQAPSAKTLMQLAPGRRRSRPPPTRKSPRVSALVLKPPPTMA